MTALEGTLIVMGMAFVPIIIYFSVKLGTYGYLMAVHRFKQYHPDNEENRNGKGT